MVLANRKPAHRSGLVCPIAEQGQIKTTAAKPMRRTIIKPHEVTGARAEAHDDQDGRRTDRKQRTIALAVPICLGAFATPQSPSTSDEGRGQLTKGCRLPWTD